VQPEEFDRLLKKTLESQDFAYDPSAWDQASKMLDARPKRRRFWWWFIPVLLLGGIAAGYWLHIPSKEAIPQLHSTEKNGAVNSQEAHPTAELNSNESKEPSSKEITQNLSKIKNTTPASPSPSFVSKVQANPAAVVNDTTSYTTYLASMQRRGWRTILSNFQKLEADTILRELPKYRRNTVLPKKASLHELSLGVLARTGQNVTASENAASRKMAFAAGVFAQYRFNERWLVETGPQLSYEPVSGGVFTRTTTRYGFGISIEEQSIQVNTAWMLQVPLLVGVQVGQNHQFKTGPIWQHYLSSGYEIRNSLFIQNGESTTSTNTGLGKVSDFSPSRFGLSLSYQYQIFSGFQLGLNYLHFPEAGGAFALGRNNQLNIHLQYTPFRKKL